MQTHVYTLLGSACLIACGAVGAATLRGVYRRRLSAQCPLACRTRRPPFASWIRSFCANSPASINGDRTPSCISKCGTSSPDSASRVS